MTVTYSPDNSTVSVTFDFTVDEVGRFDDKQLKNMRTSLYKNIKGVKACPDTLKMLAAIKSEIFARKKAKEKR